MSKILITEFINPIGLDLLRDHEVIYEPDLYQSLSGIQSILPTVDALIVRNLTTVTETMLSDASQLKVIGRLGVGLENIDLNACKKRNIEVIPALGTNAKSVAEYVIGVSISLSRQFFPASSSTLAGQWERPKFSKMHELDHLTLGIIGLGSIGMLVAEKVIALGISCIAFDPFKTQAQEIILNQPVPLLSLDDVLKKSDIVTLHLPLTADVKNLCSTDFFQQMKSGSFFINTSRGGLVDELALANALRSQHIAGAALDVFVQEPAKNLDHFKGLDNLILTPHIAGVTIESNERVSIKIATAIDEFLKR
jgi:(S)-sulfolactate dehydrogenase